MMRQLYKTQNQYLEKTLINFAFAKVLRTSIDWQVIKELLSNWKISDEFWSNAARTLFIAGENGL